MPGSDNESQGVQSTSIFQRIEPSLSSLLPLASTYGSSSPNRSSNERSRERVVASHQARPPSSDIHCPPAWTERGESAQLKTLSPGGDKSILIQRNSSRGGATTRTRMMPHLLSPSPSTSSSAGDNLFPCWLLLHWMSTELNRFSTYLQNGPP